MQVALELRDASALSQWDTAHRVWDRFVTRHPELRYPRGRWGFVNFIRAFRQPLIDADAIRLARNKFWVAHEERFPSMAFALATGYASARTPRVSPGRAASGADTEAMPGDGGGRPTQTADGSR